MNYNFFLNYSLSSITHNEIEAISIVSQIFQTCVPQMIKSEKEFNINALLSICYHFNCIFKHTNIAPSLPNCNYCKTANSLQHEIINNCEVTLSVLLRHVISKNVLFDKQILEICASNILAVDTLYNCQAQSLYKSRCTTNLLNLMIFFFNSSKVYASFGIHSIKLIIETFSNHPNILRSDYMQDISIFKYLYAFFESDASSNSKESVLIGYLYAIFLMTASTFDEQKIKLTMHNLCTQQSKLTELVPIRSYLEENDWKYMGVINIPKIQLVDLLLLQLQHGTSSWTITLALIENIFNENSNTPIKCLTCIYAFEDQVPPAEIIIKLQYFYSVVKKSSEQMNDVDLAKWHSLSATLSTLEYLNEFLLTSEKYKNHQIDLKSPENIFRELNVNVETKLFKKLTGAIKEYRKFICYINSIKCTAALQMEINHALIYLRKIAQHLTVRNLFKEAMAAYMSLYTLAQTVNNKFGKIHAVTYFACNSRDYPIDHNNPGTLNNLISQSNEMLVTALSKRKSFSCRKQCYILYCMINIALYTMEQNKMEEAQMLMEFVDTMITEMEQQFSISASGVLRIRYYNVLLIFVTKYNIDSSFAPILFAEYILKACKTVHYVLPEDSIIFPIQLNETIVHIAEYMLSRYDYVDIDVFIQMLLKLAMRMGLSFKMAKLLALSGLIDLYKEDYENFEVTFIKFTLPIF